MRLVDKIVNGTFIGKIYKNTEWNEYIVKTWYNNHHNEDANYHTDDLQDAIDTCNLFSVIGYQS